VQRRELRLSKLDININLIAIIQEARRKLRIKNSFLRIFCQLCLTAGIIIFINSCQSQIPPNQTVDSQSLPIQTITQSSKCDSPSNAPQDNPVATKYKDNAFSWTKNIKWDCVYNIKDFPASNIDASFNAARDAASANGGGIVYFPSGTYNFADNIYLKGGVVIRGDTPTVNDAKSNSYNPSTKLVFPQYKPSLSGSGTPNNTAFKKILTTNSNKDSNLGVVNVDINRAAIEFSSPENSEKITNQNIIVFGVRSNNVADPEPRVPESFQNPWQRFSNRFAANIKIQAFANVLISNNRLNDAVTDNFEQPNYIVKQLRGNSTVTYPEGEKAKFNYTNHYGISLNRFSSTPKEFPNDPNRFPNFFRKGLVIQDNWVYHTMRVAIHATGDGLIIKNNQIKDEKNKQVWIDPTGTKQPQNAATFENRAIDWSGWNVTIDGNDYEVYRHKIADGNYESIDGEGILIQECCGGTSVNGVKISNNTGNSYIGIYKVPQVKNVLIAANKILTNITNTPAIYVNADTNGSKNRMDNVKIQNNTLSNGILARASLGGSDNSIEGNWSNNGGDISYSCEIKVENNIGFAIKQCGT
jgi:Pectate lyase superfamily protein